MAHVRTSARAGVLLSTAALIVAGCGGSGKKVAVPCSEAQESAHPLACEQEDQRAASPALKHETAQMEVWEAARRRAKQQADGGYVSAEDEQRAREEIEAAG